MAKPAGEGGVDDSDARVALQGLSKQFPFKSFYDGVSVELLVRVHNCLA